MPHSRREFIRYVVAGSVASGCPVDTALISAPDSSASIPTRAAHPSSTANTSKSATKSATATISISRAPPQKPTS